jgi:hypothetical protein
MKANISSTIIHFKFWFSQSVNDYKAVIVPIKHESPYRQSVSASYYLEV